MASVGRKRIKHLLEYVVGLFFTAILNLCPLPVAVFFAEVVGNLGYLLWVRRRKIALANVRYCFPAMDDGWVRRVARRSFVNFARTVVDFMRVPRLNEANFQRYNVIVNRKSFDDALAWGKGAILFTGHFGSWEQTAVALRLAGYPVNVVVAEQSNPYVDRFINRLRSRGGIGIIPAGEAVKRIIKLLRSNEMVALLADQDGGPEGVVVEFFGRPASVPKGPAALALKTGAAICAGFTVRASWKRNVVFMEDAFFAERSGDAETDVLNLATKYTKMLEDYVRRYPDHYLWMHRRFKTTCPSLYPELKRN